MIRANQDRLTTFVEVKMDDLRFRRVRHAPIQQAYCCSLGTIGEGEQEEDVGLVCDEAAEARCVSAIRYQGRPAISISLSDAKSQVEAHRVFEKKRRGVR